MDVSGSTLNYQLQPVAAIAAVARTLCIQTALQVGELCRITLFCF